MMELKNRFLELKEMERFHRVDPTHPIAWYIGLDGSNRYSLFAITDSQPKAISSTKMMSVYIGNRRDGKYGITFSLIEKKNLDLFVHFCDDMISYSRSIIRPEHAADFICSRYLLWQKAFTRTNGKLLSFEQIKGLIGELCFLKTYMLPHYGPDKAIESWSGIEATDQDFTYDDTWFEVKSTVSGSPTVKISSVEQLDTTRDGHLVVVILDKTSDADTSRITLNSMVDVVVESIPSKMLQDNLKNRLLAYGYYYDKEYDRFGFKYNGMTLYSVNSEFPCLRKNSIPVAVQNAKYDLSLAAIDGFKEE